MIKARTKSLPGIIWATGTLVLYFGIMQTSLTNASPFHAPFWCFNGHLHTIAPYILHHPRKPAYRRIEIPTPDDDFLEQDVIDAGKQRPAIALFHGLEGSTLYEFDNQITAPVHGFKDADEYYARCSSNQFIPEINCPALLIHSREDPICPVANVPLDAIQKNPSLDYIITGEGGHVGFRSRPQGWLGDAIVNYIRGKID